MGYSSLHVLINLKERIKYAYTFSGSPITLKTFKLQENSLQKFCIFCFNFICI